MSRKGYQRLGTENDALDIKSSGRSTRSRSNSDKTRDTAPLMGLVQNVKSKNVYVFGDGTMGDDEDETHELTSMTQRAGKRTYQSTSANPYDDVQCTEIPLQKDDTLQSISIKFRCPVQELKRLNNIMNEAEIHALPTLRIPVRSHQTYLKEELEQEAKERLAAAESAPRRNPGPSIVSSETEDEEASPRLQDLVDPHDDPEDMESIALLDRDWPRSKTRNNIKQDRRKFDKFMTRKDQELEEIIEQVQNRSNALSHVTASMRTGVDIQAPPPRKCLSPTLSTPCVLISAVVIVIGLPFAGWYLVTHHLWQHI